MARVAQALRSRSSPAISSGAANTIVPFAEPGSVQMRFGSASPSTGCSRMYFGSQPASRNWPRNKRNRACASVGESFSRFSTIPGSSLRYATAPLVSGRDMQKVSRNHCAMRSIRQFPIAMTRTLRSVISSIAYFNPSRPRPLSFTPPYGMWSMRKVGTSPTMTPPTSSFS
jgi:hypothetical protein